MNLLQEEEFRQWQSDAYYHAARRRDVAEVGNVTIGVIEINPGGNLLPHIQPNLTLYCCVRGAGTFLLGERQSVMTWGEMLTIPPRTIHAFSATGDAPLVLLVVSAPGDENTAPENLRSLLEKLTGRLR